MFMSAYNSGITALAAIPSADLSVLLAVNTVLAHRQDLVVYTATVRNHGPDTAENPFISITIPEVLTPHSYSLDNGATWVATYEHTISILMGPAIYKTQTGVVLFRGHAGIAPIDARGNFSGVASISSATRDPNPANNEASSLLTKFEPTSELKISVHEHTTDSFWFRNIMFDIDITNLGPAVAPSPLLTFHVKDMDGFDYHYDREEENKRPWPGQMNIRDIDKTPDKYSAVRIIISKSFTDWSFLENIDGKATISSINYSPWIAVAGDCREKDFIYHCMLSLHVEDGKATPVPGTAFIYTATISNSKDTQYVSYSTDAVNAILIPTFSPMLTGIRYSYDRQTWYDYTSGAIKSPKSKIPPDGTAIIYIEARVPENQAPGSLCSSFAVENDLSNFEYSKSFSTVVTPVLHAASLRAANVADRVEYYPGEDILYSILVDNQGPGVARALTMRDTLPPSVPNPQYSIDNGTTWRLWPSSNEISLPDIQACSSASIFFKGTLGPAAWGSLAHTVAIDTATPLPGGIPHPTVRVTTDGNPVIAPLNAVLSAIKTIDKTVYFPGEPVTYAISMINNGASAARLTTVTDILPGVVESQRYNVEGEPGWHDWSGRLTLEEIPAGGTTVLQIGGRLSDAATGSLKNTASIVTVTPQADGTITPVIATTILSPEVTGTAELSVTKKADRPQARPGEEIVYTVEIANNGPAAAEAPVIIDAMPYLLENPEYSLDQGAAWLSWTGWLPLAAIPANGLFSLALRGTVSPDATGSVVNTAAVTTSTPRPDGRLTPAAGSATVDII
jgi:uncharacterized repeat protein (TIGR01451 family)